MSKVWGDRVTRVAALGFSPLLYEDIRWFKPKVIWPRGVLSDADGVPPTSKGMEGANAQAHIAKLMHGT